MFPIPFNFPFIKKNGERTTIGDAINAGGGGSQYTLPTASANTKGGVKIGSGLKMTGEVLSADLPIASADTLGGVKVGSGLSITDGVLSAAGGGGGGTQIYYKNFNDISFSSGWSAIATGSSWYLGESSTDININGYTPILSTITDKFTGYPAFSSVCKNGTNGNTYRLNVMAKKNSASESFNARVYYIASTDLTPIPS